MEQLYLSTEGIFGSTLGVSASYVMLFVLFGAFMERSGTGQLFMDFAMSITGHTAGGPGKVAVVSSSLFGTVSGSAVANVMVDGPITIPLMKRTGFRPPFAAAVEAVASTGGQIMPPVMGAAAFVMAEFLAVPYAQVALWAAMPALLYYVAVFFAVHFEAKRYGLAGVPQSELPRFLDGDGGARPPVRADLRRPGRPDPRLFRAALRARRRADLHPDGAAARDDPRGHRLAQRARRAGRRRAQHAGRRDGLRVRRHRDRLRHDHRARHHLHRRSSSRCRRTRCGRAGADRGRRASCSAWACRRRPSYIVMVSLLVPAIIKLGAIAPAAHMFAFYFAILSAITPPVALAVFAAAGLARTSIWSTGWEAVRLAAPAYIVPFMFIYEPSLLLIGDWFTSLTSAVSAVIGVICLAAGLQGYLLREARWWERAVLLAAAILLIKPGYITDAIGLGAARARHRRAEIGAKALTRPVERGRDEVQRRQAP